MAADIDSKRKTRRIAQHEAGHYVVARVLGFTAWGPRLKLITGGGYIGQAEIALQKTLQTIDEIKSYLRGRAIVLAAGALGESIELGRVHRVEAVDIFRGASAQQDYAKYREMVYLMRSVEHAATDNLEELEKQLSEIDGAIWDEAMQLVRDEQELIVELAKMLAAKVSRHDEFVELTIAEIDALPSIQKRFPV
ncbi:MAG TPA: hypothetical protein VKT73_04545 [Xanthobacteraceae bacterium]|nr:hypothetical protein [Xanthobacteraceae bacterium]